MSYDYIGLVNDVCGRLNETQLTSANFSSATSIYTQIKEAINSSMRHINQSQFYWPFNHAEETMTLSAGVARYAIPFDTKAVDFETFRIRRNTTLDVGNARRLKPLSYDEYVDLYIDQEDETDTSKGSIPECIIRSQAEEFILYPFPDKAYELTFEYFTIPVDLINSTDVPRIPERFRHVIVDGAMYYVYMFRDNLESATIAQRKFDEGIKDMRTLLTNEYFYIRAV
jgi:hypothetical protein